jgi:secreted trypsin-like serine protease
LLLDERMKKSALAMMVMIGSVAHADVQTWIVGGKLVPAGERRAVASIEFPQGLCTGVLIAPDLVLTARHCLFDINDQRVDAKAVVLGSTKALEADEAGAERIVVARTLAHPTADLALLVLAQPSTILPIPVLQGCALDGLVDGATASVVGYGAHDACGKEHDPFLREASLTIDDYRCAGCGELARPGEALTASALRSSACFGDSGGPLILATPHGDFVAGIVSAGKGTDDGIPCASTNLFVRPDAFVGWIEAQAQETLPAPTCGVDAAPYVVGGSRAPLGKWPQVTLVAYKDGFCTGVLVAPDVVLTAGHCIEDELPTAIVGAALIDGNDGESIPVTRAIRHPQLDLGVLVLARASSVEPAAVADSCAGDALVAGGEATMVGFGLTDRCGFGDGYDGGLRDGALQIVDPECATAGTSCAWPGAELIASSPTVNGCFGDSGGPLYVKADDRLYVAGITSRGASEDPLTPSCDGGGIYARVDAVNAWIEKETGRTLIGACDLQKTGGCSSGGAAALPFGLLVLMGMRRRCNRARS